MVVQSPHHEELQFASTRYALVQMELVTAPRLVALMGVLLLLQMTEMVCRSPGMVCRGMRWADQSAPRLIEWIPDYGVDYVQTALRTLSTYAS